jgi:Spy/CpxP family protein refolding chaperone
MTFRTIRLNVARLAGAAVILAGTAFGQATTATPATPGTAMTPGAPMPQTSASERMASHLTRQLGLTDAQSQQVKQIMDSKQDKMAAARTAMMTSRESLRKASQATPLDEASIRSAAQALGQAEGDNALIQAQLHAQIVQILTDEQKQKFAAMSGPGPMRGPGTLGGPPTPRPQN